MDGRVVFVKTSEGEIFVGVVLFPGFRDFSASPHEDAIDFVISFFSVNAIDREAVFPEVFVEVSDVSVLQVVGQIANNAFALVFDVLDLPERPALVVELAPEFAKCCGSIRRVAELSLPVVEVEGRFGEQVERIDFLLVLVRLVFFLGIRFLFLLLVFLFLGLLFFLGLLNLLLRLFLLLRLGLLLLLLLHDFEVREDLECAKPGLSELFSDFLMSEQPFVPLDHMRNGGPALLNKEKSQSQSDVLDDRNISDGDLIACQVWSFLQLAFNDSEGLQVFLLSSFVLFLGGCREAEDRVGGAAVGRGKLAVAELQPLVNRGCFSSRVAVEFACFAREVSEDCV